jgi:YesN/AraC family two-component response regulator
LTHFLVKPVEAKTLAEAIGAMRAGPDARPLAAGPVLVVDDDPQARAYLANLVEQEFPGCAVRAAADGASALEAAAQQAPSLVVLDLIMPGVDGFQVLERLRASEPTRRVPILILTGHLLGLEDIKRLEQYALVTVHSKGLLSDGELAAAMHRSLFGTETLPPYTGALVKRTVAYLQQHYAAPLTRAQVAGAVGVSENYLSQIFRKELGLSPWEYLTRYRIQQAEQLLLGSDESITQIAVRTGFGDPGYFGRVFRKATGQSPSAFRAARPAPD